MYFTARSKTKGRFAKTAAATATALHSGGEDAYRKAREEQGHEQCRESFHHEGTYRRLQTPAHIDICNLPVSVVSVSVMAFDTVVLHLHLLFYKAVCLNYFNK